MFNDDNKEVREQINKSAVLYIISIGGDCLNSFLPLYKKSIEDVKWRVRYEGYEGLFQIAIKIQNADLFSKTLEPLFMNYLKDKCFAVQELGYKKLN